MDNINRSFAYFAIGSWENSQGISKKIRGVLKAADKLGFKTKCSIYPGGVFSAYLKMALNIAVANEDYLMVRSPSYGGLIIMFGMIAARLRGNIIILDVPTPNGSAYKEIINNNQNIVIKIFKIIFLYIAGPWSFWPANLIVQYSEESWWFRLGNQAKSLKMGNGIDVKSIPFKKVSHDRDSKIIRLIGVANVSVWHGYDLVIKAIKWANIDDKFEYNLSFTIVGEGSVLDSLKKLSCDLDVKDYTSFTGKLTGDKLFEEYEKSDIAIGSLGLHRIGLNEAGTLKLREYCAIGIPFIYSGIDHDFDDSLKFCVAITQSEDPVYFIDGLKLLASRLDNIDHHNMRKYAINNLSHESKLRSIISRVNTKHHDLNLE